MNWKDARDILDGKGKRRGPRDSIKIARNTYLERGDRFQTYDSRGFNTFMAKGNEYPDNAIGLRLHNTYVVIFTPHWTELNTGGWPTVTTANRIGYAANVNTSRHGWGVCLQSHDLPCFCTHRCVGLEIRPGYERYFTDRWTGEPYDHDNGSRPIYEWRTCSDCNGTLKRSGADWQSGGHPFFDGIRISADGMRLMKTQPHKPVHFQPLKTASGW